MPVAAVAGFRGAYDATFVMGVDYGYQLGNGHTGLYVNMSHMF